MQNSRKKLCIGIGLGLLGVSLTAGILVIRQKPQKEAVEESIKVGMTVYEGKDVFVSNTLECIEYYMDVLKAHTGLKIDFEAQDGQHNQETQNEQIETFIKEGYDVIIVNTVEREEAGSIIDKVQKAGIPTIFFNREPVPQDMQKWESLYYVGSSAQQAGKMQGEILIEAIEKGLEVDKNKDGKIQYVMLEGEYGHQDAILRTYYCIKTLEDRGFVMANVATDTAGWRRELGKAKMEEWLEAYSGQIEVVLANNDEMALGAIEALGDQVIPVIGVDGIEDAKEAIREGKMIGTVWNNSDEQARCIVAKIDELLTGGRGGLVVETEEEQGYFWVGHQKITQENVNALKNVTD